MNKYFILLVIVVSLFGSLGLISASKARQNKSSFANLTATPRPKSLAEIESIELDRAEVIIPCPSFPGNFRKDFDDSGLTKVKTIVNNPQNRSLSFQYTVSAGKIVGQGENVIWDLRNVRPGTYTIKAAISGNREVSKETKTQEIKVIECPIEFFGSCPTLSIMANEKVNAGEVFNFTAQLTGGTAVDITYKWTISQGEIVEGQETSEIKVKTTPEMSGYIKASVEIDGSGFRPECLRTESATTEIIKQSD